MRRKLPEPYQRKPVHRLPRNDEWLRIVIHDGADPQPDAHSVHGTRHAAMSVPDEPDRSADLACGGKSFECDKRTAIVHHPLR